MPVLLVQICTALMTVPQIYGRLELSQLVGFLEFTSRMLPIITLPSARTRIDLPPLPSGVCKLASTLLSLPVEDVKSLWEVLGSLVVAEAAQKLLSGSHLDDRLALLSPYHDLGMSSPWTGSMRSLLPISMCDQVLRSWCVVGGPVKRRAVRSAASG